MRLRGKAPEENEDREPTVLVPIHCVSALLVQSSLSALARALPEIIEPLIAVDWVALVLREGSFHRLVICGSAVIDANETMVQLPADLVLCSGGQSPAELKGRLPEFARYLEQQGVQSICVSPFETGGQAVGALIVGRQKPNGFTTTQCEVLASLAIPIGVMIERISEAQSDCTRAELLERERQKLFVINQVANAVTSELDLRHLVYKISETIKAILGIEYADLLLYDEKKHVMRREAVSFRGKGLMKEAFDEQICDSPPHLAIFRKQTITCDLAMWIERAKDVAALKDLMEEGLREGCAVPLVAHGRCFGALDVLSSEKGRFTPECVSLLEEIAKPIAIAVDNALAYREITELKDKLAREKEYLEGEVRADRQFDEIIGQSEGLRNVLKEVEIVADSDANVLILGETGTGKELIARALHESSGRKLQPFIKLNCAAIPGDLLESELFGHEKGAFTGAVSTKIGLMELADGGTLFLDEVGDIPLHLQPKLLRVIQERKLTRLGSTRTKTVDFRLISATNQDLAQMVAEKDFRADLYYRLRVFPLVVPPLRERRDDIPLLVQHFTKKFALLRRRSIESIPDEAMEALTKWDWPGNIRELENLIERAVILSSGNTLAVPLKELTAVRKCCPSPAPSAAKRTADGITAEIITRTLRETNGIVAGPRGAAARLGLRRSTFLYKMHILGISPK